MKLLRRSYACCVFLAFSAAAPAQFVWTGIGNGWLNQLAPPNDGTANIILRESVRSDIPLTGNFSVNSILVDTYDRFRFVSASPITLTITSGVQFNTTDQNVAFLDLDPNINVNFTGSPVLSVSGGVLTIPGQITGTPTGVSVGTDFFSGTMVLNNTGAGNTYTGPTVLNAATGTTLTVAFWNNSPFGSGPVTISGNTLLIGHGTRTVANNFTFSPANVTVPIAFRSWDAPLTLSGAITLANSVIVQSAPAVSLNKVDAFNNTGVYPRPGPFARFPTIFTGTIAESGGARTLTVGGAGINIFKPATGNNTYTGGTIVNGTLIFGNNNAIPAGTGNVTVNATAGANGYAGTAIVTPGNFAAFLSHIATGSAGAVGVDTLPGDSTATLTDNIDLTGFTNSAIRLGTATSAIFQGSINPQGNNYQFGNGGGTLYVQSDLPNPPARIASQVVLGSALNGGTISPLKLYLQGNLSYTGGTTANNGFIIFDSGSFPGTGSFTAAGSSTSPGASYIGYTNFVDTDWVTFLSNFNKANTWGIVGLDTHAGNSTATFGHASSPLDLTGFNDGVFVGTTTQVFIDGPLTPTSVANANNAANKLRFTAGNGGRLIVKSDIAGSVGVVIGSPSGGYAYSDGTVVMVPTTSNTYAGGTTVNNSGPITLEFYGSSLGTGPLTFTTVGGATPVGLQSGLVNDTLPNAIYFNTPGTNQFPTELYLTGSFNFTLAGAITGPGNIHLVNPSEPTPITVTVSGDNSGAVNASSGFTGDFHLINGTLKLSHNNAAGYGTIFLSAPTANLEFTGATAPVIYGIYGSTGNVVVPGGTNLTINVDEASGRSNDTEFGGVVTGAGSLTVTGTAGIGSDGPPAVYLYGNNTYSGGTSIAGESVLVLGRNSSAGTGAVSVNATGGGIGLNSGVTLSNNLTFVAGALTGLGTFDPANLSVITFNTNRTVAPGFPTLAPFAAGTLTLAADVVFADGGSYYWSVQDFDNPTGGYSQLIIQGNLNLTATTGGFDLDLWSFGPGGDRGLTPFTWGQTYNLTILQTTGSITGFNASNFSINTADFQGGLFGSSNFTLSATSNSLVLNFTAVPEPSAYALMALGLAALVIGARRRRVI